MTSVMPQMARSWMGFSPCGGKGFEKGMTSVMPQSSQKASGHDFSRANKSTKPIGALAPDERRR
jgi:hypothetical protein